MNHIWNLSRQNRLGKKLTKRNKSLFKRCLCAQFLVYRLIFWFFCLLLLRSLKIVQIATNAVEYAIASWLFYRNAIVQETEFYEKYLHTLMFKWLPQMSFSKSNLYFWTFINAKFNLFPHIFVTTFFLFFRSNTIQN